MNATQRISRASFFLVVPGIAAVASVARADGPDLRVEIDASKAVYARSADVRFVAHLENTGKTSTIVSPRDVAPSGLGIDMVDSDPRTPGTQVDPSKKLQPRLFPRSTKIPAGYEIALETKPGAGVRLSDYGFAPLAAGLYQASISLSTLDAHGFENDCVSNFVTFRIGR